MKPQLMRLWIGLKKTYRRCNKLIIKKTGIMTGIMMPVKISAGDDLLSHEVALAVPWALTVLTSVFGMGTGVALSLKPPAKNCLTVMQG